MKIDSSLHSDHLKSILANVDRSMETCGYDQLLISSGDFETYFLDDRHKTFVPNPHFVHWCPQDGENHLISYSPGSKPKLYFHQPIDFWLEPTVFNSSVFWANHFDVEVHASRESIWNAAKETAKSKLAFIGFDDKEAEKIGAKINCSSLLHRLNWQRRIKSPYEVFMTEKAVDLACHGHLAAKTAFEDGASELEIFYKYQETISGLHENQAYEPIIALNEKASFLHYHGKRSQRVQAKVLLIDAGAKVYFYNSDITRTFCAGDVHPIFQELVNRLDQIQRDLCALVSPGASYLDMQTKAMERIADCLCQTGILKVSAGEAFERRMVDKFLPHGLGHQLGIQVHDVGGRQANWAGDENPPSARFPKLRSSTPLVSGQLCTIEPGIYFIPHLLDELKSMGPVLDLKLATELVPLGGIRIEDDVLVTSKGHRNLTRESFKKLGFG